MRSRQEEKTAPSVSPSAETLFTQSPQIFHVVSEQTETTAYSEETTGRPEVVEVADCSPAALLDSDEAASGARLADGAEQQPAPIPEGFSPARVLAALKQGLRLFPQDVASGNVGRTLFRDVLGIAALVAVLGASYWISFLLRFDAGDRYVAEWFWMTVPYVVTTKLAIFVAFRLHRSWGRFLTFNDLLLLTQASTLGLAAVVIFDRFFLPPKMVPRGILVIDWGTTILLLGGCRASLRALWDHSWHNFFSNAPAVLIAGADQAGEELLRAVGRHPTYHYRVVGFLDRDGRLRGTRIGGVPVVGSYDQACEIGRRLDVKEILLAGGALTGKEVRKLMEETRRAGIVVRVLPTYEQLLSGRLAVQPRPIAIEDLLRREPVQLEWQSIRQWIEGRVLLVTGSAGSIGSEIARQLLQFSPKCLVLVDRSETGQFFLERELAALVQRKSRFSVRPPHLAVLLADVLDGSRMEAVFRRYRPEVVFHAAAYKHVPLMERHPGEAVKNIVLASKQVADLAHEFGADSFVMISTDKAVNPTSVMGACKRLAEMYVQSMTGVSQCRFITVRFGNVLDSAGSVVPIFRQQIAEGGPVTITDPRMERFFMTIPEAAGLVIQAGVVGESGQILVLDMGDPVKIIDLAADMIRLSGFEVGRDIEIQVVGLRPGEKLYEELQAAEERTVPTRHQKIRIALGPRFERNSVLWVIRRLSQLADDQPEQILLELQHVVPGYRPNLQVEKVQREHVMGRAA